MEIKRLTKEELQAFARLKGCKIENLYYRGDISLLQKPEKIIALIGRRNADADVLRNANRCGKILAESGAVTLNGLAVGCDTAGLEGALAYGGKCIVVMPCGLDYIYPKCNDSLVENILKYSLGGTRVYIDAGKENGEIFVTMKNISAYEMNFEAEEMMERFVRGDESRTSEGHGLGLAIASSYTANMGGRMELAADGDLFKVILRFPEAGEDSAAGETATKT